MVVFPADTPVTSPVVGLTVALAGFELFQIPPTSAPVTVIKKDDPTHTDPWLLNPSTFPALGTGLTVSV